MNCFWPRCSDRKRCDAFGSCVAIAQSADAARMEFVDRVTGSVDPGPDIRWGINVLLEKIAEKFDGWETMDIWRSDAAMVVRSFKNDSRAPEASEIDLFKRRLESSEQLRTGLVEYAQRLVEAMREACDLLAEREHGNPARSPGHNARLRLEGALAPLPPVPQPEVAVTTGHSTKQEGER